MPGAMLKSSMVNRPLSGLQLWPEALASRLSVCDMVMSLRHVS